MLAIGLGLKSSNLDNLIKRMEDLEKQEAFVGVKPSQGVHSSGLNFTDLLWIHHMGVPSRNIPSRPISSIAKMTFKGHTVLRKSLDKYFSQLDKKRAPVAADKVLQPFAEELWEYSWDIFGDTSYLENNAQSTIDRKGFDAPMFETGELRGQWSYYLNDKQFKG
ncbi:coil containing protein [Vibrio phage 1.121.O._10N.286.46.C4]|nr:coil containing protein [Vibrio phage 1.121.O._10N.286.46.C4]